MLLLTAWCPSHHQKASARKTPFRKVTHVTLAFSVFSKRVAPFNAAFVAGVCFYTFRSVAYMSHQSVSEPFFPRLTKIMSSGTLGL